MDRIRRFAQREIQHGLEGNADRSCSPRWRTIQVRHRPESVRSPRPGRRARGVARAGELRRDFGGSVAEDGDLGPSVRTDAAAEHAGAVEGHGPVALAHPGNGRAADWVSYFVRYHTRKLDRVPVTRPIMIPSRIPRVRALEEARAINLANDSSGTFSSVSTACLSCLSVCIVCSSCATSCLRCCASDWSFSTASTAPSRSARTRLRPSIRSSTVVGFTKSATDIS